MQERLQFSFDALDDSLRRIGTYPEDNRFAPMAEALLWIDLIDTAFYMDDKEPYKKACDEWQDGVLVRGLRYARNRLTHDVMVYGMHGMKWEDGAFDSGFSKAFDIGMPKWRWRRVDDLGPFEPNNEWQKQQNAKLEAIYRKHLEAKEVEPILEAAANFLRRYRTGWTPTPDEEE